VDDDATEEELFEALVYMNRQFDELLQLLEIIRIPESSQHS
jgi:hypothetical protein